jgi:hypothetical protein
MAPRMRRAKRRKNIEELDPSSSPQQTSDPDSSPLGGSAPEATQRADEIIGAAETAAAEIRAEAATEAGRRLEQGQREVARLRAEAEVEAGRHVAARRREADRADQERRLTLTELAQSMLDHAQQVRDQAEAMAGELEQAATRIRELSDAADRSKAELVEEAAVAEPGSAPAGGSAEPDQALVRATQLAIEGRDREEIDRALKKKFGVVDTGPILDEVLGGDG